MTIRSEMVVVEVRLRRQKLLCPDCGFSRAARYDTRAVARSGPAPKSHPVTPLRSGEPLRLPQQDDALARYE